MSTPKHGRLNRIMLTKLAVMALVMFGFGYSMVPFYEVLCAKLGINNLDRPDKAAVAAAEKGNTQVDKSHQVTLEFDANSRGMAWTFRPLTPHMKVHPGELMQVEYEVTNTRNVAVTGQAIPSYAPSNAAQFFRKLDCFCFQAQTLKAGEVRRMPVVFVIDPDIPKDVDSVTLSYTFFEVPGTSGRGS